MGLQKIHRIACIHGRFQPFHLGHVNYLEEAIKIWPNIIIGLTAVTPVKKPSKGVEHRGKELANPLNYWERMTLIKIGLQDIGISQDAVNFIPFPIDQPHTLKYVLPTSIMCATTDLYEWNREKANRLRKAGYQIQILKKCKKMEFDGTLIRTLIMNSDPAWKQYLLPSIAQKIEEWSLRDRLKKIESNSI